MHNISSFVKEDKLVGNSALKAFRNHLWYLIEELVPLSLFSNEITYDNKAKIIEAMKYFKSYPKFQSRHGTGYGKPTFPKLRDIKNISLQSFVGPDSHQFFSLLRISETFFIVKVEHWDNLEEYIKAQKIVSSLKIVNDAAERGVKLGSDFLGTAKIEDRYQNTLQVVENERNYLPNQRKRKKVSSKTWFLQLDD